MNSQYIIQRLKEINDDIARLKEYVSIDDTYNFYMAKNHINNALRMFKARQTPEIFNPNYDFIFEQQCCFCKRHIDFSGNDLRRNLKIKEDVFRRGLYE